MNVRGSRGNSPNPEYRQIRGGYNVQTTGASRSPVNQKSPGFVQPNRGTLLTNEGVRTVSGGLDSMRPGQIRGGLTGFKENTFMQNTAGLARSTIADI